MDRRLVGPLLALGVALMTSTLAVAAERSTIDDKYKWNLADLFPSRAAWEQAKAHAAARLPELDAYRGRLGESAATLADALGTAMSIRKEVARVYVYASQLSDEDTRVAEHAALAQEAQQLYSDFSTAASFLDPEILTLDQSRVDGFVASEPRLADFRAYLQNVLRMKPHTRSLEVEKVLAQSGVLQAASGNAYNLLVGSDFPYPEITLSTGEKARLDPSGYARYRANPNRDDRMAVFKAFFGALDGYKATFGQLLHGQITAHKFERDVRGYGTCLEASLDQYAIPVDVYQRLVGDTNANLATLHRYLKLRQRMMGVDQLRYEDLYAPTVASVDMTFTPEDAMELTLAAFAPLGTSYVDVLKKGYASRWIDWYPSTGKRSGAYSEGSAFDVHPYQLLNFNGTYNDVSTLAHESGHSMHSYLSNANQPYVNADYATFVAEVASTLNESLLFRYMMGRAKDDATRLFLLSQRLEGYRQTLFRQTLFAEFELKVHQMGEAGEPITGEALDALYLDLVRRYYGHEQGVCAIDTLYGAEWQFIHHFWAYNFYVYQYATSLTASTALSKAIREEAAAKKPKTAARDAYLRLMSSGSSKLPIELLKDAGVDMTSSAPFQAAMTEMNEIMDQMETILAKRQH